MMMNATAAILPLAILWTTTTPLITTTTNNNNNNNNNNSRMTAPSAVRYHVSTVMVIAFIVSGLLAVVGLTGNLLVCWIVFRTKRMYTVANLFLMNLAIADTLVLLFNCPLWIMRETMPWQLGGAMCVIIPAVSDAFYGVSLGCITAIALHRYRMIMRPMQRQIVTSHVKYVMILIWLVSLTTISMPLVPILKYNPSTKQCGSVWPSMRALVIYQCFMFGVWYVVPLMIILITYARIRVYLQRQLQPDWMTSSTVSKYRVVNNNPMQFDGTDARVAGIQRALKILAPVVIAFSVLMLPWNALRILAVTTGILDWPRIQHLISFCATLLIANSTVNPFIYYFVSKEFRKEFRRLLPVKACRNEPEGLDVQLAGDTQNTTVMKRDSVSRGPGKDGAKGIIGRLRVATRESTL